MLVCFANFEKYTLYEENLTAHKRKVTWSLCVYIISDTIHYPKKEGGKVITKALWANISDKMFTKRTNEIVKTQINIPFLFLIYTHFCLGWSQIETFPKRHSQMLVLALEGATDGHDSLDCQMALRKKKKKRKLQISKRVTAFRKYSKQITIMRKKKINERAFYLQFLSWFINQFCTIKCRQSTMSNMSARVCVSNPVNNQESSLRTSLCFLSILSGSTCARKCLLCSLYL